jgi:hypothetical protein
MLFSEKVATPYGIINVYVRKEEFTGLRLFFVSGHYVNSSRNHFIILLDLGTWWPSINQSIYQCSLTLLFSSAAYSTVNF